MKRILAFILIISVFVTAFSACSDNTATANINPAEAAQTILDSVEFRDTLISVEGAAAENIYMLDDSVTSYCIYISGSGATAEEIAVLKVSDTNKAQTNILDKRLEELAFRYESYVPAEMVKIQNPVIITQGDIIIMVLADDAESAEKAVKSVMGK